MLQIEIQHDINKQFTDRAEKHLLAIKQPVVEVENVELYSSGNESAIDVPEPFERPQKQQFY